jgi:diaminopimelate epimerase
MSGIPFVKGHGTENDFVLLPDRDGLLKITDSQVRALCDRRSGVGADGVIIVRPSIGEPTRFFMDYRNADGSLAEMCGNGARVFARYLVDVRWEQPGTFEFVTRGGLCTARLGQDGEVTIGMGPARLGASSNAELAGVVFEGISVDVGNPHLVTMLDEDQDLDGLDLTNAPLFDHTDFPSGVNVEFVQPMAPDHIRMRVFERGVGETRSCGTGTVAAAAAFLGSAGRSGSRIRVDVPGGSVTVTFAADETSLTGPAVLVAHGTIDQDFWEAHR